MAGPHLIVVGLSYRTAPLDVREKLAFAESEMPGALAQVTSLSSVGEAVILSTCNRVEVYAAAKDPARASDEVKAFLATSRNVPAPALLQHVYERSGNAAVQHVFRVASSLDSLVVGESQILGQLKSAWGMASEAGTVGPLLGRCLERAFGVAKRVRTETAIARGAANVSTVAVELAKNIFGSLRGKIVLVVGAGKMSDLAARHLRADGADEILVTNRSVARAEELARKVDGSARPWEELEKLLALADVVISSTGSREPIISKAMMKGVVKARRHRPIFMIDIAVPRDIESAAGKLDNVYLYDIDDLEKVVAENRAGREKEASAAERIVENEVTQFTGWMRSQGVVPTIKELRARFHEVAVAEAERTLAALGGKLDERGQAEVRRLAEGIVNKLLHTPLMALKQGNEEMVVAARRLFELGDGEANDDDAASAAREGRK